jgi:hypothetical protein
LLRTLAAFALLTACAHAQQAQPQLPTCSAPEYRAFDFWLGEWDVYVTGTENLAGRSSIASENAGCVITENWTSARAPYNGQSINMYDRANGRWNQYWMDSTGEVTRFEGGPFENGMRLVDPANIAAGQDGALQTRMTFTANADGSVRQHGETSPDGATWTTSYDLTYRRRAAP